jgi:Tfp pilus assembly protein PilO
LVENPARLRVVLTAAFLLIWYFLIYSPLSGKIRERTGKLVAERERLELAKQVDQLRRETSRVTSRMPEESDGNEWMGFLMNQVRRLPLKLVSLDPRTPTDVGPYKLIGFRLTVEGRYADAEKLLRTIETSPRILRVEIVRLSPKLEESGGKRKSTSSSIELQTNILGLIPGSDREKTSKKASATKS